MLVNPKATLRRQTVCLWQTRQTGRHTAALASHEVRSMKRQFEMHPGSNQTFANNTLFFAIGQRAVVQFPLRRPPSLLRLCIGLLPHNRSVVVGKAFGRIKNLLL
jgi:hypothetical protein